MGAFSKLNVYPLVNLAVKFVSFGLLTEQEDEEKVEIQLESVMHSASVAQAWLLFCDRAGQAATVGSVVGGHRYHKAWSIPHNSHHCRPSRASSQAIWLDYLSNVGDDTGIWKCHLNPKHLANWVAN